MLAEAGYMSLGALIGTIWWLIFIFLVFKPELKALRTELTEEKTRIETKIDEQLSKIPEDLDINAKIEEIKVEFTMDKLAKPLFVELKKPMKEWDKDMLAAVANVTSGVVNQLIYAVENDERFDVLINGKMKGIAMNMKKEFRQEMTEAVPEIAKSFGVDPEMLKGGMDVLEKVPEDYRWMVQLFQLYMKGGIPGMGGGPPVDYYGGY